MLKGRLAPLCLVPLLLMPCAQARAQSPKRPGVSVVVEEAQRRVNVLVDGRLFTAYIWPDTLKKPVLYPLRAASGTQVTRGFPLEPRAGERADHPHQVGFWFTYGDVNGVDFWNNSAARSREEQARMGTVRHRRILNFKSGRDSGELSVECDWLMPDGSAVLRETTRFIFRAGPGSRSVERATTLAALHQRVVFGDSKEGLTGLRVRRELEQPSDEPLILTDAAGRTTRVSKADVSKLDTSMLTGLYRSSEGKTGDAVWGTRGRWATLTGSVDHEVVTLALLDHPRNVGHPTYWMARGYGLFAANPLGRAAYSGGRERPSLTLEPGESVTFRHRLLILDGPASTERIEAEYRSFSRG